MENLEIKTTSITTEEEPKKRRGRKPKTETVDATTVNSETPKKRGRKPKAEDAQAAEAETEVTNTNIEEKSSDTSDGGAKKAGKSSSKKNVPDEGTWSDKRIGMKANLPVIADTMKIEIQLIGKSLGMAPSDPSALIYTAKEEDEVDIYPEGIDEEKEERTFTVWPRAKFVPSEYNGVWTQVNEPFCPQVPKEEAYELPFIFDYQLRGMFKDTCGLLSRAKNNKSSDLKAYKKQVDGNIFVSPRKIAFNVAESYIDDNGIEVSAYDPENPGRLRLMARPLRTSGPTGERSAIAISEVMPPMSTFKFEILMTNKNLRSVIEEWLDYGLVRGLGQWRNSGIGTFRWRLLDDNWNPIVEDEEDLDDDDEIFDEYVDNEVSV